MGSGKVDSVNEELTELNEKFHKKKLLGKIFYQQLIENGFSYNRSFLVSIFPDSSNTYCGKIIRQDGSVFEFDIDLDFPEDSVWKDITDDFLDLCKRNITRKPWLKEVVAYGLFNDLKH